MPRPDSRNVTIRLPLDLAEKLDQLAAAEDRSLNAQIVRMLREAMQVKTYQSERLGAVTIPEE